jgi:hypothetical protein
LNDHVINKAKIYSRKHNISRSKIIESYLDTITKQREERKMMAITLLVQSLIGVIDLPADFDYKKAYLDFLDEKYK